MQLPKPIPPNSKAPGSIFYQMGRNSALARQYLLRAEEAVWPEIRRQLLKTARLFARMAREDRQFIEEWDAAVEAPREAAE